MQIVDKIEGKLLPRNVGLMFFTDDPEKYFPYSKIEIVTYTDKKVTDEFKEKIFSGPIDRQIRDSLDYLRNTVLFEKVIKHPDRAEADRFFNYPFAALEEAIVNAFYHGSYEIREPIEVRIFTDRIEIISYPGLDRSLKISDLIKGKFNSTTNISYQLQENSFVNLKIYDIFGKE
jgi:ATP-dependent DNA helicase RecG